MIDSKEELASIFKSVYIVQDIDEVWWLVQKLNELKPQRILEIGVEKGGTLKVWSQCLPNNGRVIGVDIQHTKENLSWDINDTHPYVNYIQKNSHDLETFKEVIKNEPLEFDFLFIDGDHTYEGVRQDYEVYGELVRKGGIIGFHDIGSDQNNDGGVRRLWKELESDYHGKTEKMEQTIGIGILYKQ